MSAFVVDPYHVDALMTAALQWSTYDHPFSWHYPTKPDQTTETWMPLEDASYTHWLVTIEQAQVVGKALFDMNVRAVCEKYEDDPCDYPTYEFRRMSGVAPPVLILKAIGCLRYQLDEDPWYELSEAAVFLDGLQAEAIARLDGYDDCPWGIDGSTAFLQHASLTSSARRLAAVRG